MLIHALMCWLSWTTWCFEIKFSSNVMRPLMISDYKVRFCENIQYQWLENYIQFDANYLKMPIKQDSKSWHQFIQQTPHTLLDSL